MGTAAAGSTASLPAVTTADGIELWCAGEATGDAPTEALVCAWAEKCEGVPGTEEEDADDAPPPPREESACAAADCVGDRTGVDAPLLYVSLPPSPPVCVVTMRCTREMTACMAKRGNVS